LLRTVSTLARRRVRDAQSASRSTAWLFAARVLRSGNDRCDNSRVELCASFGIIKLGKCPNKKSAGQRRHEEEHMTLSPLALNVVMALVGISIPALVYIGCIMTSKKKTAPQPREVAPHFELDRAA
jgi:hypothetical protein